MRYLIVAVAILCCSLCLGDETPKDPSEFKSLTVKQARAGIAMFTEKRLDLSGLMSIDKDVAKELKKFKGNELILNGLTSIDKDTARELAEFKGDQLELVGLSSIDKDVAHELANCKVPALVVGSTSIDKDVAHELATFKGDAISFGVLASIDNDVAHELSTFQGTSLYFPALYSINKDIARELATFKGELLVLGVEKLKEEEAKELSAFKGAELLLKRLKTSGIQKKVEKYFIDTNIRLPRNYDQGSTSYLPADNASTVVEAVALVLENEKKGKDDVLEVVQESPLDKDVARTLALFKGNSIYLSRLSSIDRDVAHELAKFKGRCIRFQHLTSLDKDVAHELAMFQGDRLEFYGLTSIDKDAVQELQNFKGFFNQNAFSSIELINKDIARGMVNCRCGNGLDLSGLTSIDKDTAYELAQIDYGDFLILDGLTSIDKDVARAFAKCKPQLCLNGLSSIDKDVAHELAKNVVFLNLRNPKLSLDDDTVKELAQKESGFIGLRDEELIEKIIKISPWCQVERTESGAARIRMIRRPGPRIGG